MDEGRAVLDEMEVGVSVVLEERDAVRVGVGGSRSSACDHHRLSVD